MRLYVFYNKIGSHHFFQNRLDKKLIKDHLLRAAWKDYGSKRTSILSEKQIQHMTIGVDSRGKPFFCDTDIFFSVSHSGGWWACLMAEEPVGLDIELHRYGRDYQKIADRFFTKEESAYVREHGLDSFLDVWVRKEAYIKYTGSGISEGLSSFSVLKDGAFLSHIGHLPQERTKKPGILSSVEIDEELAAAYCSGSGDKICETVSLYL